MVHLVKDVEILCCPISPLGYMVPSHSCGVGHLSSPIKQKLTTLYIVGIMLRRKTVVVYVNLSSMFLRKFSRKIILDGDKINKSAENIKNLPSSRLSKYRQTIIKYVPIVVTNNKPLIVFTLVLGGLIGYLYYLKGYYEEQFIAYKNEVFDSYKDTKEDIESKINTLRGIFDSVKGKYDAIKGTIASVKEKINNKVKIYFPTDPSGTRTSKGVTYNSEGEVVKCLFCDIQSGLEPSEIVLQNEQFVVFKTRSQVTKLHYLVTPRTHSKNASALSGPEGAELVRQMVKTGKFALGADGETALFCFHMAPFNSIDHIHLHAIGQPETMSLFGKMKYSTRFANCKSADQIIEKCLKDEKK